MAERCFLNTPGVTTKAFLPATLEEGIVRMDSWLMRRCAASLGSEQFGSLVMRHKHGWLIDGGGPWIKQPSLSLWTRGFQTVFSKVFRFKFYFVVTF